MLSQQAITEYRKIYKKEHGVEISMEEATDQGEKLLRLFQLIYRPVSKNWQQELERKYAKSK